MATFVGSPQDTAAYVPSPRLVTLKPKTPAASSPKLRPQTAASMPRLLFPLLFGVIGASLGTLTGVGVAFATTSAGSAAISSSSVQASASQAVPVTGSPVNAVQSRVSQAPAVVPAGLNAQVATSIRSASSPAGKSNKSHIKKELVHYVISTSSAVTAMETQPVATPMAQVQELATTSKLSSSTPATTQADVSHFSVEGDLQVVDYDAQSGTIQTIDGKVFSIGTTQSTSQAASWDDYRSDVHYRCGQNGSCVLSRAGVSALNARVI